MIDQGFALQNWYNERGLRGAIWSPIRTIETSKAITPARLVLYTETELNAADRSLLQKIQTAAAGSMITHTASDITASDTVIVFGKTNLESPTYQCCALNELAKNPEEKMRLWDFLKSR